MHVISVRNVHQALPEGMRVMGQLGEGRHSRAGEVLVMPGPVTTHYKRPRERVLFWPERDANPFFHFMEGLWMLAGRDDVAYLTQYVARMRDFSDDGKILHGAYGHRWRRHFGLDQLAQIIDTLRAGFSDRRCVLQMWDVSVDLGRDGKDLPCNTHAYLSRGADGCLDMTVCCRSNDMILGAYGANAVHFSMLQEFLAAAIDCEVGGYWQMSNNFHVYLDTFEPLRHLMDDAQDPYRTVPRCPYELGQVEPFKMMSVGVEIWQQDLAMFLDEGMVIGIRDRFFRQVAAPIKLAHQAYREERGYRRYEISLEILQQCAASDWRRACSEWVKRRFDKFKDKERDSDECE